MTVAINNLTRATALGTSDLVPISSGGARDTLAMSLDLLLSWMQVNLTFTGLSLAQQYAAPSATGFSVTIEQADTWLILTPVAGYAAGTIVMPAARTNQQVVQVNCTQAVTTLTVSGNGTTVTGAPTTLAANGFFKMQFDAVLNAWFRIG